VVPSGTLQSTSWFQSYTIWNPSPFNHLAAICQPHNLLTAIPKMGSFLGLPAEIRNMIYSHLSESNQEPTKKEPTETEDTEKKITDHFARKASTNILAVSRQVRNEALAVLYKDNTYHHYIYPHSRHGMYADALYAGQACSLGFYFPKAGALLREIHLHLELSGEVICDVHNPSRYRSLVKLLRSTCTSLAGLPEMKELRLFVNGKTHHGWASFDAIELIWGCEARLRETSFLYTRFSMVLNEFRILLPWVQLECGIIGLVDPIGLPAIEHNRILLETYSKLLVHRDMQHPRPGERLKKVATKVGGVWMAKKARGV